MRTRALSLLASSLVVTACAAARQQPGPAVTTSSAAPQVAAATPHTAPPGPLDASMPADPMLHAAIDTRVLEAFLGRLGSRLDRRTAQMIADAAGLDEQTIRSGQIAEAFGLDPSQPIQLAIAPFDAALSRDIDTLHAMIDGVDAQPQEHTRADALTEALSTPRMHFVSLRAAVPTRDAMRLLAQLRLAMQNLGWPRMQPPDGVEDLFATPDAQGALAISHAAGIVVIDLLLEPFAQSHTEGEQDATFTNRIREAVSMLRRRTPADPHAAPMSTEGDMIRAEFQPVSIAALNFVLGVGAVQHAVEHVNAGNRRPLVLQGAHEANRSFFLVRNERGAFFDRIAVDLRDDPSLVIRADLGPGANVPDATAWVPTISVQQRDATAQLDLSTAFVRAWHLPGESAGADGDDAFRRAEHEAGGLALVFAFPFALADALHHAVGEAPRPFPPPEVSLQRFERYTVVTRHAPDDVNVGLFAARTAPNDAACVLVPTGAACAPSMRLRVDHTIMRDGRAVRLTRVGDRFALLVGASVEIVDAIHLEPTPAPVAPAHFLMNVVALNPGDPIAALFPGVFEGEASRSASQLQFTVHPTR